jgi:hypothetical protein
MKRDERATRRRGRWAVPMFATALSLLVVLSGNVGGPGPVGTSATPAIPTAGVWASPIVPAATTPLNSTMTVGNQVGVLSSEFFGATVNNEVHLLRGEGNLINATPAHVLVWPGAMAGEDYDPLTNTHYDTYSGSPKTALTSEAQFVDMCRAIHCTSVVQLPAEIDNPAYGEKIVNYTEVNLSFHPSFWMIGNEPELWSHWQVPWKSWGYSYTPGPTPTQFGKEVLAYVADIRQVDNDTPILGLPASGCTCGSWTFAQWISGVLNVTGNKIQAVAFHEYPAGWLGTGDGSLNDFYYTLQGPAGIPTRMVSARAAVTSSCPNCNVSVWISELGSALSWSAYGQYAAGFSGSLSIAAQITQAMDVNLTNIDLFAAELATTNSWFGTTGFARPDYGVYTQILNHLGTNIYPVNFTNVGKSVYGIDTIQPNDANRQDLLIVNTNVSHAVQFAPSFVGGAKLTPVMGWYWNGTIHSTSYNHTTWVEPYTPNALPEAFSSGLPSTMVLPPQSLMLFEAYPGGAAYVRVTESGVPAPTAWYASLGGRFYTTTATNLSLLMPAGSYPMGSVPIPLPIGGKEFNPIEQLTPFPPTPVEVGGAYTNVTLPYVTQWRVNVSATPGGNVTPSLAGWLNDSQPAALTATPDLGYAFTWWGGWGPGSYSGANRTAMISPMGRVVETAHFVLGQPTLFWEDGLPLGSTWAVTVRGFTTTSTSNGLIVYEPAGVFGYHVSSVPGYRIIPQNGSFIPLGPTVSIHFIALTPPQPSYPVNIVATGLPDGFTVEITVRGITQTAGATDPLYLLTNGTYAYQVGYVPGYHADAPLKLFYVQGGPLTVTVLFLPTEYSTTWEASGVRSDLVWGVSVDGSDRLATSAWLSVSLPNGTYSYALFLPANYTATPRNGSVSVDGAPIAVSVGFDLMRFTAGFEAIGPGSTSSWSVRLGNATFNAAANRSGFLVANGTYTFDVHPPDGFYVLPSHGNLTVNGPTPFLQVHFYPSSLKPSAELVAKLTSGAFVVSAWIGLAGALGFVVVRATRRRGG